MTKTPPETPPTDICLLLEGTWPYVRGGVSSWVNQLILGLPAFTFSVFFIGGQREAYSERQYKIPPN
ncbi:MAG TPA: glycosyl transferase family 1, partial [Pseudomonas sp.]|nr:glycosyl transferase family 1 [Pseudomonas sp.]